MNRHLGQQQMNTDVKNAKQKGSRGMKEQGVDSWVQGTQVFSRGVMRGISCVVMTTYLTLVAAPAAAALRQEVFARPKPLTENSIAQSELAQMREAMRQHRLEQQLAARVPATAADKLKALFTDSPKVKAEKALAETLLGARERLQAEAARQDAEMAGTRADLVRKKLPDVILARHDAAVQTIAQRRAEFMGQLDQLQQSLDDDARRSALLDSIDQKLEAWGGKQQAKTDYKHLPWGSPDSKVRAPHASQLAYLMNLEMFGIKPLRVAGPIPAGTVLPVLPKLPSTPQPADLAETEDIQLTPAIRAKAAELHHNPVEIYRWVHDNIEYIPTYGSIQGADYALQTKRGNAFDTSSLLIGLLRASGIPARYVYGTVEVPMDKAMNWVGGVTNPNAVLELMGQGGIPNIGLTTGGKLVAVRMEHVWVEAFVDFVPSRGVKNRVPDTWVPMDASYKQYVYTQRNDLLSEVPPDADGISEAINSSVSSGGISGGYQLANDSNLKSQLDGYQASVRAYFESNPGRDAGDYVNKKAIKQSKVSPVSQVLPFQLVAVAGDFQALPDSMRHYFSYSVFSGESASSYEAPMIELKISFPRVVGKQLSLSFSANSSVDQAVIDSRIPGAISDSTQLPVELPAYLINLVPEVSVDGVAVGRGSPVLLGSDMKTVSTIYSPNSSLSGSSSTNIVVAGEYHAIAVDGQGVSPSQVVSLKRQSEKVGMAISQGSLSSLNAHDMTGLVLHGAILNYLALTDWQDDISLSVSDFVGYRMPSFGSFSSSVTTVYSWGVPRVAKSSGATMDIDRLTNVLVAKDAASSKLKVKRLVDGSRMSANEHIIPEQVFSANGQRTEAVSAVKAIQIASDQGMRIFKVDSSNVDEVLPRLMISLDVKQEIRDAVWAGRQVSVPERNISYLGWVGTGYIVVDTETGAGAYKISGGQNGAKAILKFLDNFLMVFGPYTTFKAWVLLGDTLGDTFANFFALIGITLGIFDIVGRCAQAGQEIVIQILVPYIIINFVALIIMASIGLPFLVGLLVGYFLDKFIAALKEALIEGHGCHPPLSFRLRNWGNSVMVS